MKAPSPSVSVNPALYHAIQSGDANALRALYEQTVSDLTRLAYGYTQSRDLAEDTVQEVFVALWDRRATLDVHENLIGYLSRATRNRAINLARDRNRALRREERAASDAELLRPVAWNLGERNIERTEQRTRIHTALAALPPRQREVFLLHREHELRYAEIAELLGIGVPSARNLMSKAVQRLAELLASS